MSSKFSRIFPLLGSRKSPETYQSSWNPPAEDTGDAQFARTWLEIDSESTGGRRFNRGTIMGILIVFTISGGFWTAVGLLASRLLR